MSLLEGHKSKSKIIHKWSSYSVVNFKQNLNYEFYIQCFSKICLALKRKVYKKVSDKIESVVLSISK